MCENYERGLCTDREFASELFYLTEEAKEYIKAHPMMLSEDVVDAMIAQAVKDALARERAKMATDANDRAKRTREVS